MYTPTQLDIINMFGKKELTEGCIVGYVNNEHSPYKILRYSELADDIYFPECMVVMSMGRKNEIYSYTEKKRIDFLIKNILGHIPHLEDVFRVAKENLWMYEVGTEKICIDKCHIFGKSYIIYDSTLPLFEQPEETLLKLLKLFK